MQLDFNVQSTISRFLWYQYQPPLHSPSFAIPILRKCANEFISRPIKLHRNPQTRGEICTLIRLTIHNQRTHSRVALCYTWNSRLKCAQVQFCDVTVHYMQSMQTPQFAFGIKVCVCRLIPKWTIGDAVFKYT